MLNVPTWTSPLSMACDLDPSIRRTPALEILNRAVWEAFRTPDSRLCISMPPQEGKTVLFARWAPIWALWQRRELRMAYVSYELGQARDVMALTRDTIITHTDRLGFDVDPDTSAKNNWKIGPVGGVYSVGIGGPLTGRAVDMMIIDDPFKGPDEADSLAYRTRAHTWWEAVGSTRLAPGAPVIVIQTRWNEDDMIGWLLKREDGHQWKYVNIPAQAEEEGDILGRQPGEFMVSARGRTETQWKMRKASAGSRIWAAAYQGHPSPVEGGIFQRSWWQSYPEPIWAETNGVKWIPGFEPGVDEMIVTLDCAFKAKVDSDYVAAQVWMRRGPNVYLLDQRHGHYDFVETCQVFRELCAQWPQADLKLIEDAANGPAVIATLSQIVPGIVPETPQGSKKARAYAITPFAEAGNVHFPAPEIAPWIGDTIEELSIFDNGAHDDRVDALTMAINRLLVRPFTSGKTVTPDDYEELDNRGWLISPV